MKKRIKRGARVDIACGYMVEGAQGGMNVITYDEDGRPIHRIHFDAEDIRRIQTADLLEDVPEPKTPGQRLYEECGPRMWHREGDAEKAAWEAKAARLGIKPEGE